jgi:hypothetical protein
MKEEFHVRFAAILQILYQRERLGESKVRCFKSGI